MEKPQLILLNLPLIIIWVVIFEEMGRANFFEEMKKVEGFWAKKWNGEDWADRGYLWQPLPRIRNVFDDRLPFWGTANYPRASFGRWWVLRLFGREDGENGPRHLVSSFFDQKPGTIIF